MSKEQNETHQKECLLNRYEAANVLRISYRSFARIKPSLIANGLQEIRVGHSKMYRQASLDRLIVRAAEKGIPLGKATR
jgi:hypothetical protein